MTTLFWIAAGLILWPWLVYPATAWLLAWLRPSPPRRAGPATPEPLTVVIVARDEGQRIGAKLDSLATAGIPPGRMEVLVVDDGSTDDTAQVAAARGARVLSLGRPRGKAIAINAGAEAASHPLLVLTDARQPLAEGALRALVAPFDDPRVGAVGGELQDAAAGAGALYRRFDDALRRLESTAASTTSVAGAIWAVRRALLPRLPAGLILDDVYAPLAVARAGRRVVIEPTARALEVSEAAGPGAERRRRLRTLAGNLQLLAKAPWVLMPFVNPLWWRFASHKLTRLVGPFALGIALAALPMLAPRDPIYAALAAASVLALVLAAIGRRAGLPGAIARAFAEAQWLCLLAWIYALAGRAASLWRQPAETLRRAPEASLEAPHLGSAGASHGL